MNRPTHLNVSIDFRVPMRASIPIHQDTDLETAVRSAYTAARDLAADLAAGLHQGPAHADNFAVQAPTWQLYISRPDYARDVWLSDRQLGWTDIRDRGETYNLNDPGRSTLQAQGYLPWDNCPTPDGEHCALQIDHDWKEGVTHTCAEIPGHRMSHTCTCGHEWQDPR